MFGADMKYHIHRRLENIMDTAGGDTLGNISILAVGDLYPLQPVVCGLPLDDFAELHGSLSQQHFQMVKLTESMRQKEDLTFAETLNRVRMATCSDTDIGPDDSRYPDNAIHVFKTNKEVDEHNLKHLYGLNTPITDIKVQEYWSGKPYTIHKGIGH